MLHIRAGHLELFGRPRPEDSEVRGLYVAKDGFVGLESQVAMRRTRLEIPNGHGIYAFPGKLQERLVPIDAWCVARDEDDLQQWNIAVKSLGARGGTFRVVFDFRGLEVWADANIGATGIQFQDRGNGRRARVQIPLEFAKPQLYGVSRPFALSGAGATVEVAHEGNFEAEAIVTVAGNYPNGFRLAGPGGAGITVIAAASPASPLEVNLASGWVRRGGARLLRATTVQQPFVIPGGTAVPITLSAPFGGSGSASGYVLDTFN